MVFHVLHVEEAAAYIDVGRNSGLQKGTKLSLFHASSLPSLADTTPSSSVKPTAELKVLIVADSSAVCEILSSPNQVQIGDVGFITPVPSAQQLSHPDEAIQPEDHRTSESPSGGGGDDDKSRATSVPPPVSLEHTHTGMRIGLDYDGTKIAGGFRSSEIGFQVSSDMTKILGTNWNFTGYWRGRLRQTYSGFNRTQLESLADRIDRTYHIGLYYESPTSPIIAGFGRLSVPGAPSLLTIDGAYFGRKITHHLTLGVFGGSTPDPTAWDYNPNQRIFGLFTNIEYGDFSRLHFSGAEGIALTFIRWNPARQFAFFENTISWKQYLWFYNSTQVDAARTSPLPGGGSNGTGVSFTSSSLRFQPTRWLSLGLDHSYLNSLPNFDPNLLGTSLLDKYIFQGLSVDARVELPRRISVFTQLGRNKSIADSKEMWNKLYGVAFGNVLNQGISADVRYAQFNSSFGRGSYRALSLSRKVNDRLRIELLVGSQSLVSPETQNTAFTFVTQSATWNLGPRYFVETGFTWSRGVSMNYQQWNMMFGYRFGSFAGH